MDGEWDRDVAGDPRPPWVTGSSSSNGELNHNGATNNGKVDHTRSDGGEQTTGASGVNFTIVGDRETNVNLGYGMRDCDGAYDDGEVDRTGSGGGEQTTGACGINVIVVGD